MKYRKILFAILLLLFFSNFAQAQFPKVSEEMPDFTLQTLSGNKLTLSDFRGKSNVVLFSVRGWMGFW